MWLNIRMITQLLLSGSGEVPGHWPKSSASLAGPAAGPGQAAVGRPGAMDRQPQQTRMTARFVMSESTLVPQAEPPSHFQASSPAAQTKVAAHPRILSPCPSSGPRPGRPIRFNLPARYSLPSVKGSLAHLERPARDSSRPATPPRHKSPLAAASSAGGPGPCRPRPVDASRRCHWPGRQPTHCSGRLGSAGVYPGVGPARTGPGPDPGRRRVRRSVRAVAQHIPTPSIRWLDHPAWLRRARLILERGAPSGAGSA